MVSDACPIRKNKNNYELIQWNIQNSSIAVYGITQVYPSFVSSGVSSLGFEVVILGFNHEILYWQLYHFYKKIVSRKMFVIGGLKN